MRLSASSKLVSAAALLGLGVQIDPAHAAPITFSYTGGFQSYTIGTTGVYDIVATGAQGGTNINGPFVYVGGFGAKIGGDFTLTSGTILNIAIGGAADLVKGGAAGGGGGSFVVTSGNLPLVIAGGGGGGGAAQNGFGGRTETSGGGYTTIDGGAHGYPSRTVLGGVNGGGGGAEPGFIMYGGGGGGGFSGDGASTGFVGVGGKGYPDLSGGSYGTGSQAGGYGGGGGGGVVGGGGGGGFSGGAGGFFTAAFNTGGQEFSGGRGGGSFLGNDVLPNTDLLQLAGYNSGNGFVTIDLVSAVSTVPLPASAPMFGAALLALGAVGYGRRRKQAGAAI